MSKLTTYLENYALVSLEKQVKLGRLVTEHTSELDLEAGKIIFPQIGEFPMQVLGTESDNTLTWLWAWSEEQTEIAEHLLKSAFQLKEWGTRAEVEEFMRPSVDLSCADGNAISLIATEICNAGCYYRSVYEGGSAFVLLFGESINRQDPLDSTELFQQLTDLGGTYEVSHRRALLSYLRAKRLGFTESGALIIGELSMGDKFNVEFDPHDRMVRINGQDVEQRV